MNDIDFSFTGTMRRASRFLIRHYVSLIFILSVLLLTWKGSEFHWPSLDLVTLNLVLVSFFVSILLDAFGTIYLLNQNSNYSIQSIINVLMSNAAKNIGTGFLQFAELKSNDFHLKGFFSYTLTSIKMHLAAMILPVWAFLSIDLFSAHKSLAIVWLFYSLYLGWIVAINKFNMRVRQLFAILTTSISCTLYSISFLLIGGKITLTSALYTCIAYLASIVIPIPLGFGIREFLLVSVLRHQLTAVQVVSISLTTRIFAMFCEVTLALILRFCVSIKFKYWGATP